LGSKKAGTLKSLSRLIFIMARPRAENGLIKFLKKGFSKMNIPS